MSGRKSCRVSVDQSELRRLRQAETRLRAVQEDLPEIQRRHEENMRQELENQHRRINGYIENFAADLNDMKSDLVELDRQQQHRLNEGLKQVQQQMNSQIGREKAERIQQTREMRREYKSLIEKETAERQQQMAEMKSRVSAIENRELIIDQMANSYLQDVQILFAQVEDLPHNRYTPGELSKIRGQIAQAKNNLDNHISQSAISGAQTCYSDLLEVRAKILYERQMFEEAFLQATLTVKKLLAEVEAHSDLVYPEAESKDSFKVDFWSGGMLSEITASLNEIEKQLKEHKASLTIEQVNVLEEQAEKQREKILKALETAKISIVNSQACYNVSQIVENVLAQQGYQVIDGVYEEENMRKSYALKMQKSGGDEIVTIVTPSPDRELEYNMEMNFFDRLQDEKARQEFFHTVREGLNEAGLTQESKPQTTRNFDEPNESVRDFESFSRKAEKTRPQQSESPKTERN